MKQSESNPFKNSDSNKRYYTYDYYLKKAFGGKCAKIPLNAGFTCPNIDGRCGYGGCIYCSESGSGDFTQPSYIPIKEQYEVMKRKLSSKWSVERCIPYFQAHTNTYAPVDIIKGKFEEALQCEGTVGMNIATRADCLEDDVVNYLSELSERTVLTVELGLQTVHDDVARFINRGHSYAQFIAGYEKLRRANPKIKICIHLIFGLPFENEEMMLESAKSVARLMPDMVKIHLLHVIKNTPLADLYGNGDYIPMEKCDYVRTVSEAIEYFHEDTVIARLTGDGMKDQLLAPLWSLKKVSVINDIDKYLFEHNMWQGRLFSLNEDRICK